MDDIKKDNKEEMLIDEEEAKKQFLKELKNKNKAEQNKSKEIEESKVAEEAKIEAEAKAEKDRIEAEVREEKNRIGAEAKAAEEAKIAAEAKELEEAKKLAYKSEEIDITVLEDKELVANDNKEVHKKVSSNSLKTSVIDTAVVAVVSLAGVGLLDLILRLIFGYYIVDYRGFFIIFLLVLMILYPLIMENTKCKKTLGQKFNTVEVQERNE